MALEFPLGWACYAQGRPVRRVVTNGNAQGLEPTQDFSGVHPGDVYRLSLDAVLYGDAWVDLEGRRVDPAEVECEGPKEETSGV